jgi:hypothetical protein
MPNGEDPFVGELPERFPRHSAHDDRGERIAGVAVDVLGAGDEVEHLLARHDVEDVGLGDAVLLEAAALPRGGPTGHASRSCV